MKKFVWISVSLLCGLSGNTQVYGETQLSPVKNDENVEGEQYVKQKKVTKEFIGRGNVESDRSRQQRSLRYSSLEPVGLYAEKGDVLTINVNKQDLLELVVGTPERNEQKKFSLKQGTNVLTIENEGAIYITNPNDSGSATVTILGATGQMPYFELNITSNEDFKNQMSTYISAKDVQLVSNKAIITVSYDQAKKNINNPNELMDYYDTFLMAQDRISGITDNGRPENLVDRHYQHFIEVSRLYMFATQEYMGFNGDGALLRLLNIDNGWGIWHESGHQRQQSPWKWSSVTESSVNIYSMAAQKEITGQVTAMDQYYPQMHTYLESENKDFEKQNNNLKMVMFGQLANTFGDNFYPVLHQYYRENGFSYNTDDERIQNFIINVSNITGYNMVPYFEQWGFNITKLTREKTSQLLNLPDPIWLNDNKTIKKLPMRLINSVSLSEKGIDVDLTTFSQDVFQGQKVVLTKNGKYASELTNKKPYYSVLNGNQWKTSIDVAKTDNIQIEVRNSDGTFQLYNSSIVVNQLQKKILEYLNSNEPLSEILTQSILDDMRSDIDEITDDSHKKMLSELLEKLEKRYLMSLVKDITLNEEGNLLVEFTNTKFKEYNKIVILGTGKYIAEISNGKPYYGSLSGNILKVPKQNNQENFSIQFRLPHQTYTFGISKEELQLKNEIQNLFLTNGQLKDEVTQEKLDDLRTKIATVSEDLKKQLNSRLHDAQQLFFERIISSLDFKDNKVVVSFANDLYKNYKVVLLENNKYMAEITNGKPYYGQISGLLFTSNQKATNGSLYEVAIRHSSGNYKVKERVCR